MIAQRPCRSEASLDLKNASLQAYTLQLSTVRAMYHSFLHHRETMLISLGA